MKKHLNPHRASLGAQMVKIQPAVQEDHHPAPTPGSIPGSGRSLEEGIGYLLQYSWSSLMAQIVKENPPAMWET